MTTARRLLTATLLAAAVLAFPGAPATAAPGDVEAFVHFRSLTLPEGGSAVEDGVTVLLFSDRPGRASKITLSVDLSGVAAVADVEVTAAGPGATCSTGAPVQCVLPGPHEVFERTDNGTFLTSNLVGVTVTPRSSAVTGDTGTVSITARAGNGPVTTETSTIRIGQPVNLTAVDGTEEDVPAGGAVAVQPRVRNTGPAAVEGLTAVISGDDGILAATNFGNCTYGYAVTCTFETTLAPGDTFQLSAPFTLRAPRDAVTGSETGMSVEWLTAAEHEDRQSDLGDEPGDRPGTGPDLELEQAASSSAGPPQADTDGDDNSTFTTVSVTGGRRTDFVAAGADLVSGPGTQTMAVGIANRGPGTLRYPPFLNNGVAVHVTLPAGVSVVTADKRCTRRPIFEPDPIEYDCDPRSLLLRSGDSLLFTFEVQVTRAVRAAEGTVVAYTYDPGDAVDRDPGNNTARIRVTATGLAITGSSAAGNALAGALLILLGAAATAARRKLRS